LAKKEKKPEEKKERLSKFKNHIEEDSESILVLPEGTEIPSKLVEKLDESLRKKGITLQVITNERHMIHYRGPLPDPRTLKEYDEVKSGLADIIIKEFQEQADHRRSFDTDKLKRYFHFRGRGQWLGFALGIFVIASIVVCAIFGQTEVAIAIVGGSAIGGIILALALRLLLKQ